MIRLMLVELTRLRWRRAVVALVGLAVVIPMVLLAIRAYDTRPASDDERAEAQQYVDQEQADIDRRVARCVERAPDTDPEDAARARCEGRFDYGPTVDSYLYRETLSVAGERENSGLAVVAVVAVLMLVAGTTFVGHDWNTGSMSNQLLFESRRLRVWLAKAVAVGLLAALLAVVVQTLFWGGMSLVASSRDLTPTSQDAVDLLQHGVRGTAMVVTAALGGFTLTMLSRSTVFTVGVLFVVGVAGGLIFALLGSSALRWEPATNAVAVVNGRAEYYVEPPEACYSNPQSLSRQDCVRFRVVEVQQGVAYYGIGIVLLGAASAVSYRRRDVP